MKPFKNAVIIILCLAVCPLARAEVDVDDAIRGRLVPAAKSGLFDVLHTYSANKWSDPSQDTLQATYNAAYGVTDRFLVEGEFLSQDIQRDSYRADRAGLGAQYLVLEEPFQLAPSFDVLPSLHGQSLSVVPSLAAMKNTGRISWAVSCESDIEQSQKDNAYGFEMTDIDAGGFYHFGLHGAVGLETGYTTTGAQSLDLILGGTISNNMILSVAQEFGITHQAPDYLLRLEIHFYFGRYALGGWGL
jgi:hypothetical protein